MKRIYLDNASTTAVRLEVLKAMAPFWTENFGNPGSITKLGVLARKAVEETRAETARALSRRPAEITFTSGGTESNNLAIFGVLNHLCRAGSIMSDLHFITTKIEHSSVLECFKEIERLGARVTYLSVRSDGAIDLKELRKALKQPTTLVSIAYANNEIGTIQPITEIAREVRHARAAGDYPYFHTDASQAPNYLDLNLNKLGVDLLTIDAQKIGGPKGIGALFIKSGTKISNITWGGGQENSLRPGTENVPLIVGFSTALKLATANQEKRAKKVSALRDCFWKNLKKQISDAELNGPEIAEAAPSNSELNSKNPKSNSKNIPPQSSNRLANNLNISFPGVDPEFLVLALDEEGIVCSTKSACEQDAEESYVVRALGKSDEIVSSAVRFSLSEDTKKTDIDFVLKKVYNIVYGYRKTH